MWDCIAKLTDNQTSQPKVTRGEDTSDLEMSLALKEFLAFQQQDLSLSLHATSCFRNTTKGTKKGFAKTINEIYSFSSQPTSSLLHPSPFRGKLRNINNYLLLTFRDVKWQ